jgi:hypothetical protein
MSGPIWPMHYYIVSPLSVVLFYLIFIILLVSDLLIID